MMESQENILEVFKNSSCNRDAKLQALQSLKKHFKPPDKIFSRLKLESLIPRARVSLESKKQDKNFLFNYGTSLLDVCRRNINLDSEILSQLEYILAELKKEDQSLTDALITKLWCQLESGNVFQQDGILNLSKQIIERTVMDWVDVVDHSQLEFLSKMSADSPKLFQTLTSVLYELSVRTCFHKKVLEMQKSFILCVKHVCQKKGKNFLGLYPKGCCQLVSLLMVPPNVYAEAKEDYINDVISLLLAMFMSDRKKALILLSHYSEWVSIFKLSLDQADV